jgi:hypothetical protein
MLLLSHCVAGKLTSFWWSVSSTFETKCTGATTTTDMKTSFPNVCALLVSSLVLLARSSTATHDDLQTKSRAPGDFSGIAECLDTRGNFECSTFQDKGLFENNADDHDLLHDRYNLTLVDGMEYTFGVKSLEDDDDNNVTEYQLYLYAASPFFATSNAVVQNNVGNITASIVFTPDINNTLHDADGKYVLFVGRNYGAPNCPECGIYNLNIYSEHSDFPTGTTTCPAFDETAGVCGDPHFSTWKGEHYDYHGKCDLELVSDPLFANGKGLDVHIRTEILRQWSYIKHGAIRIGNDILEVEGGADENHYWINKVYQGELTTLGGFPVKYKKANSKQHMYTIDLGNNEEIVISTFKDFVRIDFKDPKKSLYGNTVGLLADFNTGKKLGRDGFTIIEDYNDFGQEWQVLADGPKLFHEVSGRQFPGQKCVLPSELHAEEQRRRGQEKRVGGGTPNTITDTIAELACAKVSVAERDGCVSDVLITGDVDMAGAY